MSAVPVPAKRGGTDPHIADRKIRVGSKGIRSGHICPDIAGGITPTGPIGLMRIVVVGKGILRAGQQVVGPTQWIGSGFCGISQRHLIVGP